MRHPQLDTILVEYRAGLDAIYGDRLDRVILYGSQARGDAEPDSDIDVLIVLRGPLQLMPEIERTSVLTSEVSLEHDAVLSRMFVSSADLDQSQLSFYQVVQREGVPV